MDIRSEIVRQFEAVAAENNRRVASLTDDLELLASGLDSLCFAVVVTRLESRLGVDPFSMSEDAIFPVTFGEFVRMYESVPA